MPKSTKKVFLACPDTTCGVWSTSNGEGRLGFRLRFVLGMGYSILGSFGALLFWLAPPKGWERKERSSQRITFTVLAGGQCAFARALK